MSSGSECSPWKYLPFELGECEDLENYEPGGFHPVHLGDVYDGRYRVAHKLGFGGFSTVWLARDALTKRWVALKIIVARESPTYEARSVIARHPSVSNSRLFGVATGHFWVTGPNGRHLCLVLPVLGPDLSRLSSGIYSRIKPVFAREVSLQAVRALVHLHSNGLCHGDLTASNIALRLIDDFDSYNEGDLLKVFGPPLTAPIRTYSGEPPKPHAPDYIVVPLDFCSSSAANVLLSREICIIDFDQSFTTSDPPPLSARSGIPAKYWAPEVAAGRRPMGPASDVWGLGCAIFRIRSGDDLFFDFDTDCPADALRQIVKTLGELPGEWEEARFDEEGFAITGEGEAGEPFWSLDETRPLEERVHNIVDEPDGLVLNSKGGGGADSTAADLQDGPESVLFEDDAALRIPYPAALDPMVWKPTAICVEGVYLTGYSEETDEVLGAFPKISNSEASQLTNLLSAVFSYDQTQRPSAEELLTHPWFH